MADKKDKKTKDEKSKDKRMSKGWRKHVRRMKAAARKAGTVYRANKVNN